MNSKFIFYITLLFELISSTTNAQIIKLKQDYSIKYPFAQSPVPAKPDYAKESNWAALPTVKDNADLTPAKYIKDGQATAKADVFYIYPTIYNAGDPWNADVNDDVLNKKIDDLPIKHHSTVFNGACKVYAPRYRQAHIRAFYHLKDGGEEALDLAYQDVKAAFEYYLQHYNNGRPIIIAGHSQGSRHALRLVKEFFDGKPLAKQLVAAYTIGWPTPNDWYPNIKSCIDSTETGCFVDWNTFARDYSPVGEALANNKAVCTNPLTWTTDTTYAPRSLAKGIVGRKFNKIYKHAVDAQVHNGMLWINTPKIPLIKLLKIKNYHVADYNLFWLDIRANVKQRVAAFVMKNNR